MNKTYFSSFKLLKRASDSFREYLEGEDFLPRDEDLSEESGYFQETPDLKRDKVRLEKTLGRLKSKIKFMEKKREPVPDELFERVNDIEHQLELMNRSLYEEEDQEFDTDEDTELFGSPDFDELFEEDEEDYEDE